MGALVTSVVWPLLACVRGYGWAGFPSRSLPVGFQRGRATYALASAACGAGQARIPAAFGSVSVFNFSCCGIFTVVLICILKTMRDIEHFIIRSQADFSYFNYYYSVVEL